MPSSVRLRKVPHWSVEKAYERWRLEAQVLLEGGQSVCCGVYPFPSDNIVETQDEAERILAAVSRSELRGLRVGVPFFCVRCVDSKLTAAAQMTCRIAFGAGVGMAVFAVLLVVIHLACSGWPRRPRLRVSSADTRAGANGHRVALGDHDRRGLLPVRPQAWVSQPARWSCAMLPSAAIHPGSSFRQGM